MYSNIFIVTNFGYILFCFKLLHTSYDFKRIIIERKDFFLVMDKMKNCGTKDNILIKKSEYTWESKFLEYIEFWEV